MGESMAHSGILQKTVNHTLQAHLCGHDALDNILSDSPTLRLQLRTDSAIQAKGFNATWRAGHATLSPPCFTQEPLWSFQCVAGSCAGDGEC